MGQNNSIFICVLLLLFSCNKSLGQIERSQGGVQWSKETQEWTTIDIFTPNMDLKGQVKSIEVSVEKGQMFPDEKLKLFREYDEEGFIIKEILMGGSILGSYSFDEQEVFKTFSKEKITSYSKNRSKGTFKIILAYDDNGRISDILREDEIILLQYNKEGYLGSKDEFFLRTDKEGNFLKKKSFNKSDDEYLGGEKLIYDKRGNLVQKWRVDDEENLIRENFYDDDNNLIKSVGEGKISYDIKYSENGIPVEIHSWMSNSKCEFEFDDYGNWTKLIMKSISGAGSDAVYNREIIYY